MKLLRFIVYLIGLLVILAACAPNASTPPSVSTTKTNEPSNGVPPTASLVPVNLTGPKMEVGSTFLYVDGSILVAVPAGIFTMGHGGVGNFEHKVNLADYWIYRTKVTNGQYAYCEATGVCSPLVSKKDNPTYDDPLHASDPMVGVTYSQAETYCNFVDARLPTEAEYEKMTRGPDANIYPWGNGAPTCDLLNYETCVGNTTPVNSYPNGRSYYSAFDTEGNAFEWVADWFKADYYSIAPPDDPKGPDIGIERSVRSSAFNSGQNQTQAYNRFFTRPEDHRNNLGFRCVVIDPLYFAPYCQYPAVYGTNGIGGEGSGATTTVNCPNLSINQTPGCVDLSPSTGVSFNGPAGALVTVPDPPCKPDPNNGNKYICTGDGKLSICSQCTVTTTSQPQCPEGYSYDSDSKSCVSKGGPGTCLPGFVLSTELTRSPVLSSVTPVPGAQCCTVQNTVQTTLSTDLTRSIGQVFPFCPAGTFFDGQECISVQVQSPYCKSEGITVQNSCNPNGAECTLSASSCGPPKCKYGGTLDKDKCSCDCNAG
jgi:formylglycine-generating enzyme required for sulfatase activity